jgi:hypothetical protein
VARAAGPTRGACSVSRSTSSPTVQHTSSLSRRAPPCAGPAVPAAEPASRSSFNDNDNLHAMTISGYKFACHDSLVATAACHDNLVATSLVCINLHSNLFHAQDAKYHVSSCELYKTYNLWCLCDCLICKILAGCCFDLLVKVFWRVNFPPPRRWAAVSAAPRSRKLDLAFPKTTTTTGDYSRRGSARSARGRGGWKVNPSTFYSKRFFLRRRAR